MTTEPDRSEEPMLMVDDESIHFEDAEWVITSRQGLKELRYRLRDLQLALRDHKIVNAWLVLQNVMSTVNQLYLGECRALPLVQEPIVWVAGRYCAGTDWELIGVFETEDAAANAACSRRSDFIGPVTLNEVLGGEPEPWPRAYYPRRRDEE